ncbi:short-chain dehydrogenase/reductase [Aspergillus bombycis]|uniref:Short-chain dehydrogenase/reductase n=1 Tax=Aspergillus bombycis TaxID=109264 RepID=A0A1F8A4B7_9EURO|nr:short-chain dehydrogenase/reductase [Aspergillus bombycis]OGM46537.1 short-chain dehydrogenase/reductase [Aspergillus bombycis]
MSRYAEALANPQDAGDARPTALQIVKDAEMEGKLVGKSAVITGVSSGIGIETVRAIAATGATLYLTARDLTKAKTALGDFFNPDQMELVQMDQSSLESVLNATKTVLSKTDKVVLLINNAGILAVPELRLSTDGYELQFATNYLSHFLLFNLLKPAMLAATTPEFQSRVVNVSSDSHRHQGLNASDNYSFQKGEFAVTYMANELDRRYGFRGLHANSVHPGIIATGLGAYLSTEQVDQLLQNTKFNSLWKSLEQGAATTVWAAVGRELEGQGGKYLAECAEAIRGPEGTEDFPGTFVNHTYKPEDETRLWKDSLEMVGLSYGE